jgi:hypothetical protein
MGCSSAEHESYSYIGAIHAGIVGWTSSYAL